MGIYSLMEIPNQGVSRVRLSVKHTGDKLSLPLLVSVVISSPCLSLA